MNKQEKIRKGIEAYTEYPAALLQYLHSQGVVIKVDRELPKLVSLLGDASLAEKSAYALGVRDMGERMASYVAVAPLTGGGV